LKAQIPILRRDEAHLLDILKARYRTIDLRESLKQRVSFQDALRRIARLKAHTTKSSEIRVPAT
jgi:hypothetical protein